MPVQADQVDRSVVGAGKFAAAGADQYPGQDADTAQDVKSVQPGHHEIEAEEYELVIAHRAVGVEPPGEQTVFELVRVFKILNAKKDTGAQNSEHQKDLQKLLFVIARAPDAHHHGPTTDEQHHRIEKAQRLLQVLMSGEKGFRIFYLTDAEADKEAAEQQYFRGQKQPHAQLAGLRLLLGIGKVMLQMRFVFGI